MTVEPIDADQLTLLKYFATKTGGRFKAGDLKQKLGLGGKPGKKTDLDPAEAGRILAGLIELGMIDVVGGTKEGEHPRKGATYKLSKRGEEHLLPPRPDHSDELLETQGSFILLQIFRAKEGTMTRSELNGKLRSVAAIRQLEFDVKGVPETVDYHLANFVKREFLVERRKGVSVRYILNMENGAKALASMKQHAAVSFSMTGETLNSLLAAASRSKPSGARIEHSPIVEPQPAATVRAIGEAEITHYVDQLRADKYSGKDLIPIHEVRRLVAQDHGQDVASHPAFDPVLRRMWSEGIFELIAISDGRDATQQQIDDSIPGLNETIFYIVLK
jgi:hypothetical protein